jgi:hypothetical protein
MQYPSAATDPNPNRRNAGVPQFEVDKIEVLRKSQPRLAKIDGRMFF